MNLGGHFYLVLPGDGYSIILLGKLQSILHIRQFQIRGFNQPHTKRI